MMLDEAARSLIERFPLGFVATVREDGSPAVSPKGTFLVLDDETLAFSDIRSPGTIANLRRLSRVEINFIDPFARKAVRARGEARLVGRDEGEFETLLPKWSAIWPDLAPRIRHLVVIKLDRAAIVTTPPYDDGATEQAMIALYKAKFAEIYP